MDTQEILRQLELDATAAFPRQAMEAAITRRDEIIPGLLEILERTRRDAETLRGQPGRMAHIFAMFLLAQFRETRACPLIIDLFSMPADVSDELMGDLDAGGLESILASVCGGDTTLIEKLIEDDGAGEFARGAAVDSLVVLMANGLLPRERVVEYFRHLLKGGPRPEPLRGMERPRVQLRRHPSRRTA